MHAATTLRRRGDAAAHRPADAQHEAWYRHDRCCKDLIDIPEAVHTGDFVMRLVDGRREQPRDARPLRRHPQLAEGLRQRARLHRVGDHARARARRRTSTAASARASATSWRCCTCSFSAIPSAARSPSSPRRSRATTASCATQPFELVPFHMIGAESMEQAIFGGYVEHSGDAIPDAPLAGRLRRRAALRTGRARRARSSATSAFFATPQRGRRSRAAAAGARWRRRGTPSPYDARSQRARRRPRARTARRRRSSRTLCPATREAMSGNATGYVDFDTGLAELARHATAAATTG